MTHEMFENRAFRDGGAYGEHRAYGAKGANPVPEQRSHHTQWSLDEHADGATGPGSTRASSRPPTTPSRAFTGICTGAGRATSRAGRLADTHVRPLRTARPASQAGALDPAP